MFFFNVCRTIKIQLIQLNTVNLLNFYEQIPNLKMSDYLFCVTSSWDILGSSRGQGSGKWGRWGRIFPDKAKSYGQFEPKKCIKFTYSQTDRQTDRKKEILFPDKAKYHFNLQT